MKYVLCLALALSLAACGGDNTADITQQAMPVPAPASSSAPAVEGIGVAIVIDSSGSMSDSVRDGRKMDIAKKSAVKIAQQVETFAKEKGMKIGLTAYSFDSVARCILPVGDPSAKKFADAIAGVSPNGNTAIGDAIVAATRELNQKGYTRIHVLVVTDGESNAGQYSPDNVARAYAKVDESNRPRVYLVAFDISADKFTPLKNSGWMVLSASDGKQLQQTLDEVVGGNILLEK